MSLLRGDRLLAVALLLAIVMASLPSVAWGHDRYDCAARGEGTKEECRQHEWYHQHQGLTPWLLILKTYSGSHRSVVTQDVAGTFSTFSECLAALARFGKPTVTERGAYTYYAECR